MLDNLGDSGRLAMQRADEISTQWGHGHIGVEHVFLGVLALEDTGIQRCFHGGGLDTGVIADELEVLAGAKSRPRSGTALLTPRAERVLEEAAEWASSLSSATVEAPHLMLAVLREERGLPVRALAKSHADLEALVADIKEMLDEGWDASGYSERQVIEQPGIGTPGATLDDLGRDLTELARKGELHAVVGREEEMLELIGILTGKKTPNALILGEAGVGKTALVEGLAVEIAQGDVPEELRGVRIRTVEVGPLVAGTMYRGQFEERLKRLVDAAEKDPKLIIFIDEIHMLVGAGAAGGGDAVDAANILKQPLAEGRMRVIGATTEDEYRKYLQKDAALWRRFGVVRIPEPSADDTVEILERVRSRYEEYHRLTILDEALRAAVDLSVRYMSDRRLPDKALVVLDKACSQKRLRAFYGFTDLGDLSREERRALFEGGSERAAAPDKLTLDADDIALVVADMTDIPVGRLNEDEAGRLLDLEERMKQRVMGQDETVTRLAAAIRTSRAGLGDPGRPIGCFLFLGPTGTGKTELAKTLTEVLFDDERRMVRIDMAECYDRSAVSRLIGSGPGFVDSEKGGLLTEGIRKNPYTVVLLDEVEKADEAVHRLLLGMMEDGRITDALGRTVDCRNTVIIMTSNVGSAQIRGTGRIGFATGADTGETLTRADVESAVRGELSRHFAPEFLNRFDAVLVFNPLTRDALHAIARKMLKRLGVEVRPSDEAIELLVDEGYDPAMGARPVRRAVQNLVVGPLSDALIRGQVERGAPVSLQVRDGALAFEAVEAPKAKAAAGTKARKKPSKDSAKGGDA